MKILVTGHKGFIGSNLYNLLSKKHDVCGFEWGEKFPGYDFDCIIHLGAISSTTETDVEKIMIQNYDFSVNLLENCMKNNVNLQYASSASVYGHNKEFKEDSKVDPKTPYAWSKYLFDHYVSKSKRDILVQGFRYFNVYGPGEEKKADQASPYHKFRKQYEETGKVKVFEYSHNYLRDFIHVDKVCETHEKFLNIPESGLWNLGTGKTKSFLDVALSIADRNRIEYIPMPENLKNSYQEYTCADVTKLNNTLHKYSL